MPSGTGTNIFQKKWPQRFFDVGIAEAHATTFAAGLATQGVRPVVAIYSTFLQRAYDSIIHDVAIQKLPVIFCMDRAGMVGEDGQTHMGLYDIAYMLAVPHMTVTAPKDGAELIGLLRCALDVTVVNARFLKPMDRETLDALARDHKLLVTVEDGTVVNGFGAALAALVQTTAPDQRVVALGVPDRTYEHAPRAQQLADVGLTGAGIAARIRALAAEESLTTR
jgi:deoxyxylulose-5-phosphate synthase